MTEEIKDTKNTDIEREPGGKHYPPIEVAEARIKQALLKHRAMLARVTPTSEKEKVCL